MRKVAIIGSASPSVYGAPFDDHSWEIWALGRERNRVDRYFEIHQQKDLSPDLRNFYLSLKEIPVYFLPGSEYQVTFPTRVNYPLDSVVADMGRDYFCSSIAYMIQLAIFECVQEIGIWGVDLITGSEYAAQRPNTEWALGIAQGRGIKVTEAKDCALLKSGYRYGQDLDPRTIPGAVSIAYLDHQINMHASKLDNIKEQGRKIERDFAAVEGARMILVQMKEHIMHHQRGGHVPGSEVKK